MEFVISSFWFSYSAEETGIDKTFTVKRISGCKGRVQEMFLTPEAITTFCLKADLVIQLGLLLAEALHVFGKGFNGFLELGEI